MNATLRWYARLLWVGIAAHLAFAAVALLDPDALGAFFGLERVEFSYVWLGNLGMLTLPLVLFQAAAAHAPQRQALLAWLLTAGQLLAGAFWARAVAAPQYGGDYLPFLALDGFLGMASAVLLQIGLPDEARLSGAGLAELWRALRARRVLTPALCWFRRILWIGLAVNATFVIPALFAPGWLSRSLGAQYVDFSRLWIGATGVTLLSLSILYVVPAVDPTYRPGLSWLAVVARLIAAVFWVTVVAQPDRRPFLAYLATDLAIGIVLLVLLQRGSAPGARIGAEGLGRLARAIRDAILLRGRAPALRALWLLTWCGLGAAGYVGWRHLVRALPDPQFSTAEEQFKHGAIGLSPTARIPYWVWKVMPTLCADKLPPPGGGWRAFGFLFEPGHELPVGFARREIGYPSVEPNCALCHSASYRAGPGDVPVLLVAAPAHQLDLEAFQRFLYACAGDPRFTPDRVVAAISALKPLGRAEAFVYRRVIVPQVKSGLARQAREYAWQRSRPLQGRGRTDTFNPTKINVFHLPDDGSIGTTDLPAVWNQRPREQMWLHWDGNNDQIRERNYAAAMAIGATPSSVIQQSFGRVTTFLLDLQPPRYPFPFDRARAGRGQVLFQQQCAGCHAFGTARVGQITPIAEINTDRHRFDSFTAGLVQKFHEVDMPPFRFDAYRKTDGYSNLPLDGIWARAPYLHNGSVPTLFDLLRPSAERPTLFYRGYDVYDPVKVGFVSQGAEAEAAGTRYDTAVPGNGNAGHLYGTELSLADRLDLLEFLKTL